MPADRSGNLKSKHTILTYQDRINGALSSEYGKRCAAKQKHHYFDGIKKDDIVEILHSSGLAFKCTDNKENLQILLKHYVKGIARVPSLMFEQPFQTLDDMNLQHYELLLCEPLHSIAGHIKNLYEELPTCLNRAEKKTMQNTITASFSDKQAKRCADYRLSLIDCTVSLKGKIDRKVHYLLHSACEIQEILYSTETKRKSATILRYQNISFQHAMALKDISKTRKLTERKLFGQYFHSITMHAAEQLRILSGSAANAEEEERTFNYLKKISSGTSNHHPDHVISNSFIRLQIKNAESPATVVADVEARISKHAKLLPRKDNTLFTFEFIQSHAMEYQCHLERISDFLLAGNCWKETDVGIEFIDTELSYEKVKLHHFRSSSIKDVEDYLHERWAECLKSPHKLIPAERIKVNKYEILYLRCVDYFCKQMDVDLIQNSQFKPQSSSPLFPRFQPQKNSLSINTKK